MKTLEEIKNEYAYSISHKYDTLIWKSMLSRNSTRNMDQHYDNVAKLYAKEVAMQALKNAAANSTLEDEDGRERGESVYDYYDNRVSISKESILNKNNIPEM